MTEDRELFIRHLADLSRRADSGCYYTFTRFLGLAEQSALREAAPRLAVPPVLFGGCEGAERVIARFGDREEIGYDEPFPIVCLEIAPRSQKFADKLTHRDFLGALLNLGLEREMLGDIVIRDNVGYLFCHADMAEHVTAELERVKHTDVVCTPAEELPEGELYRTERRRVQASGERLDAVVAKLFSLSREEGQALFARGLVYADGREITRPSYTPKAGERISVRGHGRFIYLGYESTTRKGKLNIELDLYV